MQDPAALIPPPQIRCLFHPVWDRVLLGGAELSRGLALSAFSSSVILLQNKIPFQILISGRRGISSFFFFFLPSSPPPPTLPKYLLAAAALQQRGWEGTWQAVQWRGLSCRSRNPSTLCVRFYSAMWHLPLEYCLFPAPTRDDACRTRRCLQPPLLRTLLGARKH